MEQRARVTAGSDGQEQHARHARPREKMEVALRDLSSQRRFQLSLTTASCSIPRGIIGSGLQIERLSLGGLGILFPACQQGWRPSPPSLPGPGGPNWGTSSRAQALGAQQSCNAKNSSTRGILATAAQKRHKQKGRQNLFSLSRLGLSPQVTRHLTAKLWPQTTR